MRKLMGAALAAVVGLGLPVGAWANQGSGMTSIQQRELDSLHHRISQLEHENAQLRGQAGHAQAGVGGSGTEHQHMGRSKLEGTVRQVTYRDIAVADNTGSIHILKLSKDTQALRNGRMVPFKQLREGEQVRASFDLINGKPVVQKVEVLSAGHPESHHHHK